MKKVCFSLGIAQTSDMVGHLDLGFSAIYAGNRGGRGRRLIHSQVFTF